LLKRTKLSICLAIVSTFALASVSMAASSVTVSGTNFFLKSDTVSANLDAAGSISNVQTLNRDLTFSGVSIDMANTIAAATSTDYLRVDDNRGTSAGWHVNVSASNFTATVTDESVAGTVSVSIPASEILTVTPIAPTALFTSEAASVAATVTVATPVTSGSGVQILGAAKGYGQGVYKQQLNYSITMPNYFSPTTVITATNSASEYLSGNRNVSGAKIGIFAGTYSSTIAYSITTGP
jgi:hypothetical protein